MKDWIKAKGLHLIKAGVPFIPERLRLPLMEPLILPLGYRDIRLTVNCAEEYYGHRRIDGEPETVRWIEESMDQNTVFYDIGANVGMYSLIAARRHPAARIFAIEPAASNLSLLIANLILNGVSIPIIPVALGNTTTLEVFSYSTIRQGGAQHQLGEVPDNAYQHQLLSYRLDDLISTFHITPPTHLKIDVDGLEFNVLRGAKQALSGVRSILIEINGEPTELLDWLSSLGFKTYLRASHVPHNANYWMIRGNTA
jgi:FkbM family methyltransferase